MLRKDFERLDRKVRHRHGPRELALRGVLDEVVLALPNGHHVSVVYADNDCAAQPELDIHFGDETLVCCNAWHPRTWGPLPLPDGIPDRATVATCNQAVFVFDETKEDE